MERPLLVQLRPAKELPADTGPDRCIAIGEREVPKNPDIHHVEIVCMTWDMHFVRSQNR
jgi:hypothetical protein